MPRIPVNIKVGPYLKRLIGAKQLQNRFDDRYEEKGINPSNTEGYLVPIIQKSSGSSDNIKNELFVTIGNRRADLPSSTPISYLGSDVSPDDQGPWDIGNFKNFWNKVFMRYLVIRESSNGPQVSYNYQEWLTYVAQKLFAANIVLEGYGAHAVHAGNTAGTIKIERPIFRDPNGTQFTWRSTYTYTQIDRWLFKPWWSPTDINDYGIGIIRECVDNASPMNPGVECEIADTGSDSYIFVRFRNFLPHRVVVGVRIIA